VGAMYYGVHAAHGLPYALARQQITPHRAGASAAAHHADPDLLGAQTLDHPPAERPRPSGDQDLRWFHNLDFFFPLRSCLQLTVSEGIDDADADTMARYKRP
jgi:hypothetical protein